MNKYLFVVLGSANVILSSEDTFICEDSDNVQVFSEKEANNLKNVFDNLYNKDYSYRVAKLTFLD